MWLFPRLFALSLYCLFLSFTCECIKKTTLSVRLSLKVYSIVLALMGYFFVPASGNDLYRILITMHAYASESFTSFLQYYFVKSSTPAAILYYWVIGQLGLDGLLPAVTSLIVFGFIFSIVKMVADDFELDRADVSLIVLCFMSRGLFFHAISGIRNMISFSIISWCIYREYSNRSSVLRNLFFYLLACLFHSSGIIVVIYHIAILLVSKEVTGKKRIRNLFACFLIVLIGLIYGSKYIERAFALGEAYINAKSNGEQYSYFWEGLLSFINILFSLYCCYKAKYLFKKDFLKEEACNIGKSIVFFLVPFNILDFISYFYNFSIFHRLSYIVCILNLVLVGLICKASFETSTYHRFRSFSWIVSIITLFIACSRGNLCSLKFFV